MLAKVKDVTHILDHCKHELVHHFGTLRGIDLLALVIVQIASNKVIASHSVRVLATEQSGKGLVLAVVVTIELNHGEGVKGIECGDAHVRDDARVKACDHIADVGTCSIDDYELDNGAVLGIRDVLDVKCVVDDRWNHKAFQELFVIEWDLVLLNAIEFKDVLDNVVNRVHIGLARHQATFDKRVLIEIGVVGTSRFNNGLDDLAHNVSIGFVVNLFHFALVGIEWQNVLVVALVLELNVNVLHLIEVDVLVDKLQVLAGAHDVLFVVIVVVGLIQNTLGRVLNRLENVRDRVQKLEFSVKELVHDGSVCHKLAFLLDVTKIVFEVVQNVFATFLDCVTLYLNQVQVGALCGLLKDIL